ncbi:FAD/NAD(P)-binding domain-containing protein [Lojkania enalia]|uniref:FAD/NAD(P)-binding domain-containing protein n=1 Tax=Lojkania enalia TaxID=147567 RepID=A0A9P4K815_9PLEO|nr:FAD/NAD(P)-binding domain-containing protein [Didymosphaeria enalia]
MESLSSKPFSLAIVGGGITGLTLSISLAKHNIRHAIYESAAQFGEIGAGVGFEPNFVRTMELIDPAIKAAFLRHAELTDNTKPSWFTVRVGDMRKADSNGVVARKNGKEVKIGEKLFQWPARIGPRGGIHRAHLLDELVKLIPPHIPKFNKRLVDITEAGGGSRDVVLYFADGTTARHSAAIGCDGIKSRTREIVLGKEEARPVFSGKYAYRGLIPMEKAVEIVGEEESRSPQMYIGYHGHVLTFPISKGSIMNVVAFSSQESWTDPQWVIQSSRERMDSDYSSWSPTVRAIISAMQKPDIWALFNHTPARTYFQSRPRICLAGDAAHASTPHQGAGAGMGVEDCYILGELLAAISRSEDLDKTFRVYNEVRRPRSLKLVETSREGAMLYEFESSEKDDLEAIEKTCVKRMDWIWDHSIKADLERALGILNQSIRSEQPSL